MRGCSLGPFSICGQRIGLEMGRARILLCLLSVMFQLLFIHFVEPVWNEGQGVAYTSVTLSSFTPKVPLRVNHQPLPPS